MYMLAIQSLKGINSALLQVVLALSRFIRHDILKVNKNQLWWLNVNIHQQKFTYFETRKPANTTDSSISS